ncbi:hypothetical protein MES4922_120092 [Mesorhizobium ventifaucium]|uniref:Uncharacterized protein n=1 Tax=Mesorhizobium ventifaucium TaxID=666020 RepID=A0ABM9DHP4_9HYPH|nr:hypothetical protein MES4922_120092 [Mesorhizobium ventifaucium]
MFRHQPNEGECFRFATLRRAEPRELIYSFCIAAATWPKQGGRYRRANASRARQAAALLRVSYPPSLPRLAGLGVPLKELSLGALLGIRNPPFSNSKASSASSSSKFVRATPSAKTTLLSSMS